jgi:hypothetical protein
VLGVLETALRMKTQVDSSSRGQTDFNVEKRRERLHGGGCRRTGNWWSSVGQGGDWVFIAFFALPEGRDVSQVQTEVSWEEEVSP